MKFPLNKELSYFESIEPELIKNHLDKFAVINGTHLIGIYDTIQEAYIEASQQFPAGTFLIRQCLAAGKSYKYDALWDTGATHCVVTKKFVNDIDFALIIDI